MLESAADLTVRAAARALQSGELGVVELVECCQARAVPARDELGAFVAMADGAVEEAAELQRELSDRGPRGPLHGIPVAVKDIIDVAGLPTRGGSAVTDDVPAARDAPVVARLRSAGAVVVGKTATHELAFGTTSPGVGNPWDPRRSPGGSSGGSAVAVAVGAALVALGTDTAGSIRIPASLCGVSGLKARRDVLPMDGVLPLAPSMDSAGALTLHAEDLGLVFDVLRGGPGAPLGADADPARLRIGVPDPPLRLGEPDVRDAVEGALRALEAAGAQLVPVAVPAWDAWDRPRGRVLIAEALAAHRAAGWWPDRRERYGAQSRGYLEVAERLTDEDVAAARRDLGALAGRLRDALGHVDVLALPATPTPAPFRADEDVDYARRLDGLFGGLCGPANAANLAAVSVPWGSTPDALPLGVQFVAATETAALAAAVALTGLRP